MRQALANILVAALSATSLLAAQPPNIPGSQASNRNTGTEVRPEKGRQNNSVVAKAAVRPSHAKAPKPYQVGNASWYGKQFHGKETASGEPYDMFQFTAAHRRLPLGTLVKVTNLRNNRSVIVRVNDRGPVPHTRIIDLSYGAARMLQIPGHGVEQVRLDIVQSPSTMAMNQNAELPGR
jgi:rare lipoprotein A